MTAVKISPSLLAADYDRVGEQLDKLEGVVESVHVDVMDGVFVPNNTLDRFNPSFVSSLDTPLKKRVHLMTVNPLAHAKEFANGSADAISFHAEAVGDLRGAVKELKALGVEAGIALKPATPASALDDVINDIDFITVMTVEPGFGGQKFMEEMLPKIRKLSKRFSGDIEVDGGIKVGTAGKAAKAGATILVAGTAIFGKPDLAKAVKELEEDALKGVD